MANSYERTRRAASTKGVYDDSDESDDISTNSEITSDATTTRRTSRPNPGERSKAALTDGSEEAGPGFTFPRELIPGLFSRFEEPASVRRAYGTVADYAVREAAIACKAQHRNDKLSACVQTGQSPECRSACLYKSQLEDEDVPGSKLKYEMAYMTDAIKSVIQNFVMKREDLTDVKMVGNMSVDSSRAHLSLYYEATVTIYLHGSPYLQILRTRGARIAIRTLRNGVWRKRLYPSGTDVAEIAESITDYVYNGGVEGELNWIDGFSVGASIDGFFWVQDLADEDVRAIIKKMLAATDALELTTVDGRGVAFAIRDPNARLELPRFSVLDVRLMDEQERDDEIVISIPIPPWLTGSEKVAHFIGVIEKAVKDFELNEEPRFDFSRRGYAWFPLTRENALYYTERDAY